MTRVAALLVAWASLACATGAPPPVPDDERLPPAEVFVPGTGDDECSIPDALDWLLEDRLPQACCYHHDAAYELGCRDQAPGVERWLADLELLACCAHEAAEGRVPPWACRLSYIGVRIGGWPSWHCREPPEGRVTDPPFPD